MKAIDFTGRHLGSISVLVEVESYFSPKGYRDRQFRCVCVCGREWVLRSSSLRRGGTDCGCKRSRSVTHGHTAGGTSTATYKIWAGIIQRCCNPSNDRFEYYGGRGITVCDRWRYDFAAFLEDMGERPAGLTVERKDNSKGYGPDNCRWASMAEQGCNKRNNHALDGETLAEASRRLGLNHTAILNRMERSWSREKAFTTPRWHKSFN